MRSDLERPVGACPPRQAVGSAERVINIGYGFRDGERKGGVAYCLSQKRQRVPVVRFVSDGDTQLVAVDP
jgi:hypothetical protein